VAEYAEFTIGEKEETLWRERGNSLERKRKPSGEKI
jgi:hypothetical protein